MLEGTRMDKGVSGCVCVCVCVCVQTTIIEITKICTLQILTSVPKRLILTLILIRDGRPSFQFLFVRSIHHLYPSRLFLRDYELVDAQRFILFVD